MRRVLGVIVSAQLSLQACGNMHDVIEPHKLAPEECANGCASWDGTDALWHGGKVPDGAENHCAQPGAAVNDYIYGSWCNCAENMSAVEGLVGSLPAVVFIENDTLEPSSQFGQWVSFTGTDVKLYPKQSTGDKVPWSMIPSDPGDPTAADTYFIQNLWHGSTESRYGMWMSFAGTSLKLYPKDSTDDKVPWKLVAAHPAPQPDMYYIQNHWGGESERRYGMWVGFEDDEMILTSNESLRGIWRFIKTDPPKAPAYCRSALGVPEQLNLQIASPDTVVVSWVTFEAAAPKSPPKVFASRSVEELRERRGEAATAIVGVTQIHMTAGNRTYYMHFVRLSSLAPRARYTYHVQSGGEGAALSESFSFRAPYGEGETRIDIFGDMGIYKWNNMEWLLKDCHSGSDSAADLIIHMGDHAYNEGEGDERRADAYMSAYTNTLSQCPWMPIVGNHEYYDGAELGRYLDSTWEKWGPIQGGDVDPTAKFPISTATSALGAFLSTGNHHAAGTFGAHVPSKSSRYFSADFGLVHLIGLDFNVYYGNDPCGDSCKQDQLAWLVKDLEAANKNRASQPWIIASAHYPVFCTGCSGNSLHEAGVSGAYYASDRAEHDGNCNATASAAFDAEMAAAMGLEAGKGLGGASADLVKDIAPLLQEYGVDLFMSGHWHYYESMWPAVKGSDAFPADAVPTAKSFEEPKGTVHIVTGNGGPPGKDSFTTPIPASRKRSQEFGYGRLVAHNSSVIEFTQFLNADGTEMDHFFITQSSHGPFSASLAVAV